MAAEIGQRGALIVFEGKDKSGKSTHAKKLANRLIHEGFSSEYLGFPDRNTEIGQIIDSVLKNKTEIPQEALHLLFSANRWEKNVYIRSKLRMGCNLIIDRYSHSGVVYSKAKGLSASWCQNSEVGLPKPDGVIYLQIDAETACKRTGFGALFQEMANVCLKSGKY